MLFNKILLKTLLLSFLPLQAAEVDNFNIRQANIKNSAPQINQFGNELMIEVLTKLNKEDHLCNEAGLYKALRREFKNGYIGKFAKFIIDSNELERTKTPHKNSIYNQFRLKDAVVTGFMARKIYDPSASLILINDRLIGTDKFEHFSGTGFSYFKSYYLKKNSIEETANIGFGDEYGLLGAWTTGVISYGDLAAEFNGMRFWNHILQKSEDILGENWGPYIACENNKWIKVKEVDWSRYVDDAWDEAINCSEYRTWTMVAKVKHQLKELSRKSGQKVTCPLDPNRLQNLELKYGQYSPYMINFKGINVKSR